MDDLNLWKDFITAATDKGISINNIVFTRPNTYCISDASEFGMGGYSSSGVAWRYYIPIENRHLFKKKINLLEFIAGVITLEMELHYNPEPIGFANHHILSISDNSSACGWLYHSTKNPILFPLHDEVARRLGRLLLKHDASIVTEHIAGKFNLITDSFSRDEDLTDDELLDLISTKLPLSQVPTNLHFRPLKKETFSWLTSLMHALTKLKVSQPKQQGNRTAISRNGKHFYKRSELRKMTSWMDSQEDSKTYSSHHLELASGEINLERLRSPNWWQVLSPPPCQMYRQHSGFSDDPTP